VSGTDVDGDALTYIKAGTGPLHGTASVASNGAFTYTPNPDFFGTDYFRFRAYDGKVYSTVATVNITVNAVENLMASEAPAEGMDGGPVLSNAQLGAAVDEAIDRWAEAKVVDEVALSRLESVTFLITDLSGLTLGQATLDGVLIDVNAAGHGWYVDATPGDDLEFGLGLGELELMATSTSLAFGRMDLLTVVMHEMGHVLGFKDLDPNAGALMSGTLDAGTRRLNDGTPETPKLVQMDRVPGSDAERESMLGRTKDGKSSWLEDFLVDMGGRNYSPFAPGINSKIKIKPFEHDEDN